MPELPEAETIVRGLRPAIVGHRIRRAEVVHADVLRQPVRTFTRGVKDRTFQAVERRGKNITMVLDSGAVLAVNLGMTGNLLPFPEPPPPPRRPTHPTVIFRLHGGGVLYFNDTRRFGTVECLSSDQWSARSDAMGPEPLERGFTVHRLMEGLARSKSPARSWLLDQRKVAGIGNIYANEALYLAGVHPRRPARSIEASEAALLHEGIRDVLREAIRAGGTTIRDYRNAEGGSGEFARQLHVYGRDGEPCADCGAEIQRIVFGNRSAFFCPTCQPPAVEE